MSLGQFDLETRYASRSGRKRAIHGSTKHIRSQFIDHKPMFTRQPQSFLFRKDRGIPYDHINTPTQVRNAVGRVAQNVKMRTIAVSSAEIGSELCRDRVTVPAEPLFRSG